MLAIRDITVAYGELVAIQGISLTVERGEIYSIVGSNAAG